MYTPEPQQAPLYSSERCAFLTGTAFAVFLSFTYVSLA